MSDFTPQMNAVLTDLFMATGGEVGRFRPIKDEDLGIYEALLRYRLIVLESHETDDEMSWMAALSDVGRRFFLEFNKFRDEDIQDLPARESITLTFNLRDSLESQLYERLNELAREGGLIARLSRFIHLDALLESGDVNALLSLYPDFVEELRKYFDAELGERDTQQMQQVLSEIEAMKTLLKQQRGQTPMSFAPLSTNSSGLRPMVPLTPPESSPRQMSVPQFDVPAYDDDDYESEDLFVVQKDEDAGKRANENFLKSVMSLQVHPSEEDDEGEA